MPQFQGQFPKTNPSAPHYGFNTGFMTGMLVLGGFIGCLFYPYIADKISRKWALTVAVVFFDVGAIIQTSSHNYGTLVAGRAIGGIGVGTLAMVSSSRFDIFEAPAHPFPGRAPVHLRDITS
jgi:MFS family permease